VNCRLKLGKILIDSCDTKYIYIYMCVCVCVCVCVYVCMYVKSQHRDIKCYKIRRELSVKFCLILYQRKACERRIYKRFPQININYKTQNCGLVLCILRKESNKCYRDFRLSDTVHILWQLQLI
jgi:hypothetical protein